MLNLARNTQTKNPTTLKAAGCHLFAYAHAYQWLSGIKSNDSLLRELISVCRNPSDGPDSNRASEDINHTYCGTNHSNSTSAYNSWMRSKLGSNLEISSSSTVKSILNSESSLKAFYDNGGVIISNPGHHYVVSVGYREYNGTIYIEIVDSSRWTTIHYDGKKAFSMSNITKTATYSPNKGDRYWVTLSTYRGFRHDNAFSMKQSTIIPDVIQLNTYSSVIYVDNDNTLALNATVYPSNADKNVTWTSSNTAVATINNGIVTPVGIGKTTITVASSADNNIKATCDIETRYNGTGMIKFNEIKFPYKYKISNSGFAWKSGSGSISSDVNLDSVTFTIYPPGYPSKSAISYTKSNINSKTLNMADVSASIKFSQVTNAGDGFFEITAKDIIGRTLSLGRVFTASTSDGISSSDASTTTNRQYRINTSWQEPVLMDSTTYNGHTYSRYKATYKWVEANSFAKHLGGHLATISSAEENAAIYSLVKKDANYGAWIGCTYINGTKEWVTGEPMEYENWYSGEPNNLWSKEFYGSMRISDGKWRDSCNNDQNWMYFIVEFEPTVTEQILLSGETSPTEGDIYTLTATVLPENADNKVVTFFSSNPSIATIDTFTGEVTAIAEGETTIIVTAEDGGATAELILSVQRKLISVENVSLSIDSTLISNEKEVTLTEKQSYDVDVIISPNNADITAVDYFTTNSEVAYIDDETNRIVTLSEGTCIISVITYDGEYSDYLSVTVLPISNVINSPDLQLPTYLTVIEEEAFAGIPAKWIKLSAKVTTIGPRAFADCINLTEIYIPETATSISATAFEGVPAGLTIYTESGSYAAFYATNNGYNVHIVPSKTAAQ